MARLAVVLTEGFADWEVGQLAASARTHFGFDVVTASPGGEEVRSMGGLRVSADTVAENLHGDAFDALVICGGTIWDTERAPDLSPVINDFIARGKVTAAICGGTLALARAGALNDIAHTSNAPDFIAGAEGYLDIVKLALRSGADLKSTNRFGGTALIPAAHHGHVDTVRELIRAGVPIDHVNNLGWTALLEAVVLGDGGPKHVEIVKLLVAGKANLNIADKDGLTALANA